jgi:hypothetical protein
MRAQFNGSYELAAIPFAPIPVSLCTRAINSTKQLLDSAVVE